MVVKLNTVRLNGASLNHASLNGVGERLRASAGGGGGEVIPPEEPDVPDVPVTYILSASASNGVVSASVNGKAVTLPYTANEGDVIVVEVTANDGYVFEGWSDGSTDNPRSITMTADVTLSATCVEQVVESKYIQFADPAVEAVLMANNVSSDGIGITMEDAAKVTSIGTWFRNNSEVTVFDELRFFTGVTTLLGYAFGSCTALTSIDLRNVVTINNNAFNGCTSLQSIGSTDKVETLDGNAFYHAKSLDDAVNLPNCTQLGNAALRDTGITALYIPLIKAIPTYLCENDKALARIDISGAETIGQNAFNGCSALTNVGNLVKVVSIGATAFRETGINSDVSIPSCTTISAAAFRGCAAMTGIYAPASTFLGNYCFAYCTALKFAEFGELTTIENAALDECTSLERIIIRATTPPALSNINAFKNTNNCPIYVPDASVEAYKTATNWSQFSDRIKPLSEYVEE